MTDIKLGQSIVGSFTSTDTKIVDAASQLNGDYYDEYTIVGLDPFRQVNITLDSAPTYSSSLVQVVNADTGAILTSSLGSSGSLPITTFPGLNYKIQVINNIKNTSGNYTLSLGDGGKATSIVSPDTTVFFSKGSLLGSQVGTVGANGVYFPLATSSSVSVRPLGDIALAANGQFYGFAPTADRFSRNPDGSPLLGNYELQRIDPGAAASLTPNAGQIQPLGLLKDPQGNLIFGDGVLNSLEFGGDNQLYAVGGDDFYHIDVNTNIATLIGDTPKDIGFVSSGDLLYDAVNQRFLVTSKDTSTSDSLWQIPATTAGGLSTENLDKATKLGQIGFTGIEGLNFDNGKLVGFSSGLSNITNNFFKNRIEIDSSTGVGKLDIAISTIDSLSFSGISGSSTILDSNQSPVVTNPPVVVIAPVITTPPVVVTLPTVIDITKIDSSPIGSKSQGLPQHNTIDLSDLAGKALKVDITTKGDAAYVNNIGFYAVEDALLGTIKLANGSLLNPGDAGYALEAAKGAILQAGKIDSQLNQDLVGGKIYAPIVIAQGSFNDFINKNPTNSGGGNAIHAYVNYVAGNADKIDHFKFLGNNNFGIEDFYGGGDRDFNDLIVSVNVKTV